MKRNLQMNQAFCFKLTLLLVLVGCMLLPALGVCAQNKAAGSPAGELKVIAYYFHANTRCSNCIKIEQYSKAAIEAGFTYALKNETLEMRVINYEQPENRHFLNEYKLVTKSLILWNS
jgi:hypothetical protein